MERAWVLIGTEADVAKVLADESSAIRNVRLIDLMRGQPALVVAIALSGRDRLATAVGGIRQLESVQQVLVSDVVASPRVKTRDVDPGWPRPDQLRWRRPLGCGARPRDCRHAAWTDRGQRRKNR